MGVEKFEDLVAWQKARKLTKSIYQVTNNGPFAKDYGLRDQIRRAAVSIMSNPVKYRCITFTYSEARRTITIT